MTRSITLFFIAVLLSRCGHKQALGVKEYVDYLSSEKSGLYITKTLNGINYKAGIRIPELLALTNGNPITEAGLKKETAAYADQLNFVFLIEDAEKTGETVKATVFNKQRYGTILSYANTDLKNDFFLVQNGDTVYCSMVHLEAANSLQPVLRISVAFSGVNPTVKDYTLVFDDAIFNNGPVKFHYSTDVFENLPTLKL